MSRQMSDKLGARDVNRPEDCAHADSESLNAGRRLQKCARIRRVRLRVRCWHGESGYNWRAREMIKIKLDIFSWSLRYI